MSTEGRASRGAVGGASGEAGSAYRAGVAAYAAAAGLAGVPLDGLEILSADARVSSVELETDAAVDDIRVRFTSGWSADIQAKRTLTSGPVLNAAVAQWVNAVQEDTGAVPEGSPNRHHLVIATGRLNGPMSTLRDALNRRRLPISGNPTAAEETALRRVTSQLGSLSEEQRQRVLDAAVIWEIEIEGVHQRGAQEALRNLDRIGISLATGAAHRAWERLQATARRLAQQRGGYALNDWLTDLRADGLEVAESDDHPAGRLEARRAALERYAARLVREAATVDLHAIGANLPPLDLEKVDAGVRVSVSGQEDLTGHELLWAFLRRHRAVLTGLPGGGKSTSVRSIAGQLAGPLLAQVQGEQIGDAGLPFPVRVSLRDVNALNDGTSFRDRLITIAVRDDARLDQEQVRDEIERRLDEGLPLAVLLDSLDETYRDRGRVVSQIETFLGALPDTSSVLIATRDVAYPQAATLGWPELRVLPPDHVDNLVEAVLTSAARHLSIKTAQSEEWVSSRSTWVKRALSNDASLSQTPLMPTLLAVLASRTDSALLPTTRALVLRDAVYDLMNRHEVPRRQRIGRLTDEDASGVAMAAFAAEARALLDHDGVAPINEVSAAVREVLAREWGLARGVAQAAAESAINFLDETGVFVIDLTSGSVTPRVSLFAEVGDAMHAVEEGVEGQAVLGEDELRRDSADGGSGKVAQWVRRRISERQFEPVALAAAMNGVVNRLWQQALVDSPDDLGLARALQRFQQEGGALTSTTEDLLRAVFLQSLGLGTRDSWSDWERLRSLGVPPHLAAQALDAASAHSPSHWLLVQAELALAREADQPGSADSDLLLQVLELATLPRSAGQPRDGNNLADFLTHTHLFGAHRRAAIVLLQRQTPGAVEAIVARAKYAAQQSADELVALLAEHGHLAAVHEIHEHATRDSADSHVSWGVDFDAEDDFHRRFLLLAAEGEHAELTTTERVQQHELADFVGTLKLNHATAQSLYKRPEPYLRELIALVCTLFGFDRRVIAAQAEITLNRMAKTDPFHSYHSLFDGASPRFEANWSEVEDPEAAVGVVYELFGMTHDQAHLGALCLWDSRVAAPYAEPVLKDLLPKLDEHPHHQHWAALALATFTSIVTDQEWWSDPSPELRVIAAAALDPICDEQLTERFTALLNDTDGYVQEEALRHLGRIDFPARETTLRRIAAADHPGWRCRWCLHVNTPGRSSCEGKGRKRNECGFVGPDPAAVARVLLKET